MRKKICEILQRPRSGRDGAVCILKRKPWKCLILFVELDKKEEGKRERKRNTWLLFVLSVKHLEVLGDKSASFLDFATFQRCHLSRSVSSLTTNI